MTSIPKYSVSQDLFQYNLKTGYKASQQLVLYLSGAVQDTDAEQLPRQFDDADCILSVAGRAQPRYRYDLYKGNRKKNLKIGISISPLSYNLKTCIDPMVDHAQFGIEEGRILKNEVGSNTEVNMFWRIWENITYTTRLFLFTDYIRTFLGDWENTSLPVQPVLHTALHAPALRFRLRSGALSPRWKPMDDERDSSVGLPATFSTKS